MISPSYDHVNVIVPSLPDLFPKLFKVIKSLSIWLGGFKFVTYIVDGPAKSCITLHGWNPLNNGMCTTYQLVIRVSSIHHMFGRRSHIWLGLGRYDYHDGAIFVGGFPIKMFRYIPIGSMVLVYILTSRGYIDGLNVTRYSSTMDPSWNSDHIVISMVHGFVAPLFGCSNGHIFCHEDHVVTSGGSVLDPGRHFCRKETVAMKFMGCKHQKIHDSVITGGFNSLT